ncbi:fluoride efflux transporter CrcB [Actinocorallia longicatena]|uniref:Fluoride-specific ion channel FluC n=2 Tax=Actinocorallia longicatena TaxID=111803 RepID=A0ABP6QDT3_9ACTN
MVILGAAAGAPLRYLTDRFLQARHATGFPWGTLAANLTACAGLGFLTGAAAVVAVPAALQQFAGPGLCATLSTYSTFSYETLALARTGSTGFALANAAVSVVAGLGTASLAAALAQALLG